MIHLIIDEKNKTVLTTWSLKINHNTRRQKTKNGEKIYYSYFTTFPQELYEFLNIKDNTIYLVKDNITNYEVILTDTEPTFPITYVKVNLSLRRKIDNKKNRIPTTTFRLSSKIFANLSNAKEVQFKLHPRTKDQFRNKFGLISIKVI